MQEVRSHHTTEYHSILQSVYNVHMYVCVFCMYVCTSVYNIYIL